MRNLPIKVISEKHKDYRREKGNNEMALKACKIKIEMSKV